MRDLFRRALQVGTNNSFELWENRLIERINSLCYLAFINILFAGLLLEFFQYTHFRVEVLIGLTIIPITFLFIHYKNYRWGIYWYFVTNFIFNISLNLKMGLETYSVMYYFPIFISIVQLLGRKETVKHLVILSVFFLFSIILVILGFYNHLWLLPKSENTIRYLAFLNILSSFSSSIILLILLVKDYIKQQDELKNLLKEKEILLAEVFHRVKNNMNIVTSLLSLKKNSTENLETQQALEDCRNRVYSMALVHQNIFQDNNLIGLNFSDYIENLTKEIARSLGGSEMVEIVLDTERIELELSHAIPCGLILNELITNTYKYGHRSGEQLQIKIQLKRLEDETIQLIIKDNGPGIPENILNDQKTLGLELIRSLSEQVNGRYAFDNENGLKFTLSFKLK